MMVLEREQKARELIEEATAILEGERDDRWLWASHLLSQASAMLASIALQRYPIDPYGPSRELPPEALGTASLGEGLTRVSQSGDASPLRDDDIPF